MTTFLVNAAWQITLVAAIVWLATPLWNRLPATHRHILLAAALALGVLLPASTIPASVPGEAIVVAPATAGYESEPIVAIAPGLARVLVVLYLGSVLVLGGRLTAALACTWRARRRARPRPLPRIVRDSLRRLSAEDAPVLWSPQRVGPAVIRGAIVLPDRLYDDDRSESFWIAVLGHELAHLRRRDFEWNLLFELTSVAIGFHPATHWLKRRLDESREIACDEAVSGRYVDSASYARTLIEIAGQATSETRLRPAVAVSNGTFLEARIMRLLSDWKGKKSRSGMILGLAALGVVASIASNLAVTVRASGRSAPLEATSAALELSDSEAAQLAEPEVYQRRGQRDPFLAPTVEIQPRRVEGIGGLDVESLELRGIVETTNGFRAMVTGPDQRTYFLRGGERFFNGRLVRIAKDALAFRVRERDPLRTGVERDVVVRLHAVEEN